mmetsp:Transcript_4568/g.7073  ORF Transcript_4568/g.7073 Transcript_4568/m.7073 type:complete len:675 (+) Transcript_4568:56-2080(+)
MNGISKALPHSGFPQRIVGGGSPFPFQTASLPPPPGPLPPQVVRIQLLYDPPVEGCELCPYVLLSNANGSIGGSTTSSYGGYSGGSKYNSDKSTAKEEETRVRYRWYRCLHPRLCANTTCPHLSSTNGSGASPETKAKQAKAKVQCVVCARIRPTSHDSFFCSTDCFRTAWKKHKANHPPSTSSAFLQSTTSVSSPNAPQPPSAKNSPVGSKLSSLPPTAKPSAANNPNRSLEEIADEEDGLMRGERIPGRSAPWLDEIDGSIWLEVARTKCYIPAREDIGRVLKFEAAPINPDGAIAGRVEFVETGAVIPVPGPPPDRRLIPLPTTYNKPLTGATFRFLSYNVLAEIYATPSVYPYCPPWALAWSYRRKNLLREVLAYKADLLCLQEVQGDHYEESFKPEMSKAGYEGVYKQKTRESMGADGKMDGCAIFFKRDRFALREKHVVEYNESAIGYTGLLKLPPEALKRLSKDNVALVIVLEFLDARTNPRNRGNTQFLVVANTHIFWDPDFPDVKLWQVQTFLQELEKICIRVGTDANGQRNCLPLVIGGDFNSLPESGVHELLSLGRLTPSHPDLLHDQFGVLSYGPLQHALSLRDSYADANEELQGMPKYTNYTGHFVGEIDYVLYTPERIRLRSFLQLVPEEKVSEFTALPNQQWSSDHVALMCEFEYLPRT